MTAPGGILAERPKKFGKPVFLVRADKVKPPAAPVVDREFLSPSRFLRPDVPGAEQTEGAPEEFVESRQEAPRTSWLLPVGAAVAALVMFAGGDA